MKSVLATLALLVGGECSQRGAGPRSDADPFEATLRALLESGDHTCEPEWDCDGHCYHLDGSKSYCHNGKTSESQCSSKDVWCSGDSSNPAPQDPHEGDLCDAAWNCDGACWHDDGNNPRCHSDKTNPALCSDKDIWCPERVPVPGDNLCPESWECEGRCYSFFGDIQGCHDNHTTPESCNECEVYCPSHNATVPPPMNCPAEWECEGRCYHLHGDHSHCHDDKTHEYQCSKHDIWCGGANPNPPPPNDDDDDNLPNECDPAWNCEGHCYHYDSSKPKCHDNKNNPWECSSKDVWCPLDQTPSPTSPGLPAAPPTDPVWPNPDFECLDPSEFCPLSWDCEGRCYRYLSETPTCMDDKTSPVHCDSSEIYCPLGGEIPQDGCQPTEFGATFPDITEDWCNTNCWDGANLAPACDPDSGYWLCSCGFFTRGTSGEGSGGTSGSVMAIAVGVSVGGMVLVGAGVYSLKQYRVANGLHTHEEQLLAEY